MEFTLHDFNRQLEQLSDVGPVGRWVGRLLGMSEITRRLGGDDVVLRQAIRMRAIFNSMNEQERREPEMLGAERRLRIARGAGVEVVDVAQFLRQFRMTREMMREVGRLPKIRKTRSLVAGLVTDHPRRRDPSWVWPESRLEPWGGWIALTLLIAVFAVLYVVWRSSV